MDGFDFYGTVDSDWEIDSDDGDAQEEDYEDERGYSADHVLVLLDCGPSMWKGVFPDPEYPDDLLSPADFVLAKLTSFLKLEIRERATRKTGHRNGFGIYLYNTEAREHVEWNSPLKARQGASAVPQTQTNDAKKGNEDENEEDDEDNDASYTMNRTSTVHELIPLEPPGIATIKTLRAVQDDGFVDRAFDIQETYAPKASDDAHHDPEHTALQTAFMMAGQILQEAKCYHAAPKDDRPPDRVRIWIMSNQDMVGEYAQAAAKDLVDRNFEIVLWPLPHPDKDAFDYAARFESMPFVEKETDGLSKKELLDWWQAKALTEYLDVFKFVRPIHRLPVLFPGEEESDQETPYLQLHWFRLVQTARRPGKILVHQETGVQLNSMTQIVEKGSILQEILYEKVTGDKETSPKISPRLCSYVEVLGCRIPLSEKEKAELKRKSHLHQFASLRVIGFRPADSIDRTTSSMEQTYFCIPPDDSQSRVKGSCPAFAALHKAMMSKNALMLGEVLTRKTATSRHVAAWALPEQTEHSEDGQDEYVVRPPGLLVVVLPFRNEVKKPVEDQATKADEPLGSESLVTEAKAIVDGLTIEPELGVNFKNASLELFWDKLEEIALNLVSTRKEDESLMSQTDVVELVGTHLNRFMELLPEDPVPVKKKRERELVPDETGIDWQKAYAEGQLETFKLDELKQFLRSVGEKTSGRKQELIERVIPHLSKT